MTETTSFCEALVFIRRAYHNSSRLDTSIHCMRFSNTHFAELPLLLSMAKSQGPIARSETNPAWHWYSRCERHFLKEFFRTARTRLTSPMDNQILDDNYRVLARERSHEEARQTVATNRMLVQTLVIINGVAAVAILAFYGIRTTGNSDRSTLLLSIVLYCIGIFAAIFAGLYIRRASQESALLWELKSYQNVATHQQAAEKHLRQITRSKRWLTILLIVSEIFFLAGCFGSAVSLG
jgi:hypothetical protein